MGTECDDGKIYKSLMNVLIILGHPRKESFSEALANAYKTGALNAGMEGHGIKQERS